jgi:ABC-2 type transport system permease protein
MNYLKLFGAFLRVNVLGEFAYRANFFVQLFQSALSLAMSLGGLAVIFSYTDTLGGWRPDEILAVVGVYFLIGGVIGLIIQPGMAELIESVRTGNLDYALIKPIDSQIIAAIQRIEIWEFVDILLGLGVLVTALTRLGEQIGIGQAAIFVLMLLCGSLIVYSFFLILATLSFWFVRVENILVIFESMYEAGRWPISIYPGWLRYGLTFIVPVAFATTVPAEALTGRLTPVSLLGTIGLAALLLVVSRAFWRLGLRRYSGASA